MNKPGNYARFFGLLKLLKIETSERDSLIYHYTKGRTTSLKDVTIDEYKAMCTALSQNLNDKLSYEYLRKKRSSVLHKLQQIGLDTTDWTRIDAYCKQPRIAGKRFCEMTAIELETLLVKLRIIERKASERKGTRATNLEALN